MVVLDGIVMGSNVSLHIYFVYVLHIYLMRVCQYCSYPNCENELANAQGGVFCATHEHVAGCMVEKIQETQACLQHQD